MILGRAACFVSPSDSVAVIAAHAHTAIPYFHAGIKGLSRSAHNTMPSFPFLSLSFSAHRLFSIMTTGACQQAPLSIALLRSSA